MPYNKQLTNRACSGRTGEYWPSVVAVGPRESDLASLGPYCHDRGPIFPSTARASSVSKRLIFPTVKSALLFCLIFSLIAD